MYDIINQISEDFGTHRELVSAAYNQEFSSFFDCLVYGEELFENHKTDVLIKRRKNELHFHNFLKHQIFSRLQEIKFYSKVDISNTRRLIAVSPDCISTIHILIREEIHLNVYFRSSDFDGALPVDLEFIYSLPRELLNHLKYFKDEPGYDDVNLELIEKLSSSCIKSNLIFGSLHRTN